MHPIEQLRFVARASGADAALLAQEAASALGVFSTDPAALVTAARRLLTRQPAVGPLWWMCSRLVTSPDPRSEAGAVADELRGDRTGRELAHGLPDGATVVFCGWPDTIVDALPRRGDVRALVVDIDGQAGGVVRRLDRADLVAEEIDAGRIGGAVAEADLVLVEAAAVGTGAALTDVGSLALAATARAVGVPTWLVAGVGRFVDERYWQAIAERTAEPDLPSWLTPFEIVSLGLIDRFVTPAGVVLPAEATAADTPFAAELLRELR